jgi:hypothetical protein
MTKPQASPRAGNASAAKIVPHHFSTSDYPRRILADAHLLRWPDAPRNVESRDDIWPTDKALGTNEFGPPGSPTPQPPSGGT